jgi:two-component system response regulator RegA
MIQAPIQDEKLLLVDDDKAFLQVLAKALTRRGYDVLTAKTSEDARELAREHHPAYALVDLKLDGESGLDLIQQLKDIDDDMMIVVLTGYASIATAVAAVKRGASNYLAKPVKADEVVQALSGTERIPENEEDYAPMSVERLEWEHIQKVLQENDGNISATARSLGMYRRTLQRKLAKKPVAR